MDDSPKQLETPKEEAVIQDRQRRVLDYLIATITKRDITPSYREIGRATGIKSTSMVKKYLDGLEALGLISREAGQSRCLSLKWDRLKERGVYPPGYVPILSDIPAGQATQIDSDRRRSEAKEWVEIPLDSFGNPEELFAQRVKGDSMVGAGILEGDLLILRHQNRADKGEIVSAWIPDQDEATLKYYFPEGEQVQREPANPDYETIVHPAKAVNIQGKAVGLIRQNLSPSKSPVKRLPPAQVGGPHQETSDEQAEESAGPAEEQTLVQSELGI